MSAALVRYDEMCRAIDAAHAVDEIKAIHDKAAMLQAAARVAKNVEAETRAYEIRMRAARKAGSLSKKIEKAQGRRNDLQPERLQVGKLKTLSKAGISQPQASKWERISEVPEEQFEAALATKSVGDLIDKPTPVSHDALELIGTLRQFERVYLARLPQEFMETMTPLMLEEAYRLAPLAAEWLSTIKAIPNGRTHFDSCGDNPPSTPA